VPRASSHPQGARRSRLRGLRVHFRRVERHDRFVGGQKPSGKVASSARSWCYRPGWRWPVGGPRKTANAAGFGTMVPCVRSTVGTVVSARGYECSVTVGSGIGSGSVANRSVTCPTRLETRTKESNMCASQWVLRNLEAQ
jgi:hypothetical protein